MKKSWSTWLVASVLAFFLNLAASPVAAYYPPLQASGKIVGSDVSVEVKFPGGGGKSGSFSCPPGGSVSSLTQDNGVMAWIAKDGSTFSVKSCTFDPFLKAFVQGSQGNYTKVSQLLVKDGVVAFLAVSPSGNQVFGFTTYDPDKGNWISDEREWANVSNVPHFLVKEGVVAWVAIHTGTLVQYAIRDPRASSWNVDYENYATSTGVGSFDITNATVSWYRASTTFSVGYKAVKNPISSYCGGWTAYELTKPLAYFIAQPNSGSPPLSVWFTDMSIAGTSWNWQFGDGSTSTKQSPDHTFTSPGNFQVSLQISGPNGNDTYSQTIISKYMVKPKPKTVLEWLLGFLNWWKFH
jgi:PKD repeat protein